MTRLNELSREYEARHYPASRRLDLQGEGPETARRRALQWIQSFAHEQPGADLLLVVDRARPRARKGVVRRSVEGLLDELTGGLIDWWQPFAQGSLALRVAREPRRRVAAPRPVPEGEGRTDETAGRRWLEPEADVPPELLPLARRAAELRREREGQPVGLAAVVLREVWIEAQALAMTERTDWAGALRRITAHEEARILGDGEG